MMICADLLITDYSSVFFEYLLLDRPILFYAPDLQDYTKDRGCYLDYEALPGEIVTEPAKIGAAVERILKEEAPEMAEKRRGFRRQYMEACDGNATERILAVIRENKHTI
jgi:CDP-glycerol glycerophosphotransferase (TagB/SpsB family)